MMDEQQLYGNSGTGDWRTRSPDADQEYFIDKMRMLKMKLRKYEEENRVLYRCLAEQKGDVKDALRDKCYIINTMQYEMSELKKHILLLLGVLADETGSNCDSNAVQLQRIASTNGAAGSGSSGEQSHQRHSLSSAINSSPSEYDKSVWVSRNKTLEENFKKELKKVKELERQIGQLSDTLQELGRDREDLAEKNSFIEEENNIQREQIGLLEDTVKDLEEVVSRAQVDVEDVEAQTEVSGQELMAIMNENVEEILCLANKLTELQRRNDELEEKYTESRRALVALQTDFHERGKLMSELENELNGLKLRDHSSERRERRRRTSNGSAAVVVVQLGQQDSSCGTVLSANSSVFLSPESSSRSSSSNSSAASFEEDDESGISLMDDSTEARKTEVRKFIRNLKDRRRTLHDAYRCSM